MILNKVKYIINTLFGINEYEIHEYTELVKDLKFDSLDMYQFKKEIEYVFEIKLCDVSTLFIKYRTVGEMTEFIQLKINEERPK